MNIPDSRTMACIIAGLLDDKLAKDIEILNIKNISIIADYFVICSANSSTQVKTLAGYIIEMLKNEHGIQPNKHESDKKNRWHLIDYGDVVIHVMHNEERQYYAIEKFWSHACRISQDEWLEEIKNLKK